ncbi:MAG TPA: type IV secretory system conjugative DNA transfer family protein [Solirubrobacterales bacterium]|nr:type IV secretory system conjugative DNA transfer family protein [Solirubrobacterales bacterium]
MSAPGAIEVQGVLLAAAMATALGVVCLLEAHLRDRGPGGRPRPQGARWAGKRDLRELRIASPEGGRLVLGRQGRRLIATVGQASVAVIGPSRISYKTTGFTIPAVLEWDGPVIATSTKSDLLLATIARRRELGRVMVFDPTGATGMGNVNATPLSGCGSWHGAMQVAHRLSSSARSGADGLQDSDFWHAAAEKLIAPLLFAAADSGGTMADVIRWLNDGAEAEPEVRDLLVATGSVDAVSAWRANWNRDERQRSSIYTTAETALRAFADPRVLEATSRADYTPADLLDGGANTLYLCGPAHEQSRLASLFGSMVSEVVAMVFDLSASTGRPIEPALLMALDEPANSAPIRELDVIAATGAGQGVQLVGAVQDLAQMEARWGKRAATILNNFQATVFASGISDPDTLRYVSAVVGEGEFRQRSETAAEKGRGSSTEASAYRDLTPANVVREGKPGTGVLIYGHRPPARIALRPWFEDRNLKLLANGADDER